MKELEVLLVEQVEAYINQFESNFHQDKIL